MAMKLISTVTVSTAGVSSITFSDIPQTGKDLLLLTSLRDTGAGIFGLVSLQINGSESNLSSTSIRATTTGSVGSEESNIRVLIAGSGASTNAFSAGSFYIAKYAGSSNKPISIEDSTSTSDLGGEASPRYEFSIRVSSANYSSSSPITSLTIFAPTSTFVEKSSASLYIVS